MHNGLISSLNSPLSLPPALLSLIPPPAYTSSNVRSVQTNHVLAISSPFPIAARPFRSFRDSAQRPTLGLQVETVWSGVENFSSMRTSTRMTSSIYVALARSHPVSCALAPACYHHNQFCLVSFKFLTSESSSSVQYHRSCHHHHPAYQHTSTPEVSHRNTAIQPVRKPDQESKIHAQRHSARSFC